MSQSVLYGPAEPVRSIRLTQLFEENLMSSTQISADQEALVDGSVRMSYGELNAQANMVARCLVDCLHDKNPTNIHGKATYVIGIAMPPSAERVIATLAILKIGAAFLPLSVDFPVNRTKYMIENCHAQAVIAYDDKTLHDLSSNLQESVQIFDLNQLISTALSTEMSDEDLYEEEELLSAKTGYSIAAIFFTSGTTGKPKAVPITNINILNSVQNATKLLEESREIRQILFVDIMSIVHPIELFLGLLNGRSLAIFPNDAKTDVSLFIRLIQEYRINYMFTMTPTFLQNVLTVASVEKVDPFVNFLCLGTGAEIVSPKIIANFINFSKEQCRLYNLWGMTETTMFTIIQEYRSKQQLQDNTFEGTAAIGKPTSNMNVYILDEDNQVVQEGQVGQIAISGVSVTEGYAFANKSEAFILNTVVRDFNAHRQIFLTGDYGSICNGVVYFAGRNITRIKVRGYRVSAVEIDEVIMSLPGVKKAVTFAHVIENDDVVIVSYYTTNADSSVSSDEVVSHCRKNLPHYAIPQVFLINQMPVRPPQMKVDYPALQEMFRKHIESSQAENNTTTFSMPVIFQVLSRTLGLSMSTIDPDKSFFDLGGNSVNSVTVWSELKDKGYSGTLSRFLSTKTIKELVSSDESKDQKAKFLIQNIKDLQPEEQDGICNFITNSFYNNRNELFKQLFPFSYEDYEESVQSIWPTAVKGGLSYVIHCQDSKKLVSAGFLMAENADDLNRNANAEKGKLHHGDMLMKNVELPFLQALPTLPGKTMFGARFATDPEVSNAEASVLSSISLEHSLQVAQQNGFARFHVATMIPSLQTLLIEKGAKIWSKVHLKSFECEGSRPYEIAPDDAYHMSIVLELDVNPGKNE